MIVTIEDCCSTAVLYLRLQSSSKYSGVQLIGCLLLFQLFTFTSCYLVLSFTLCLHAKVLYVCMYSHTNPLQVSDEVRCNVWKLCCSQSGIQLHAQGAAAAKLFGCEHHWPLQNVALLVPTLTSLVGVSRSLLQTDKTEDRWDDAQDLSSDCMNLKALSLSLGCLFHNLGSCNCHCSVAGKMNTWVGACSKILALQLRPEWWLVPLN